MTATPTTTPASKTSPRKQAWATFQQMTIRYKGLPLASPERTELREQIARHLTGVFMTTLTDDAEEKPEHGQMKSRDQSEGGVHLKRHDSLLEILFLEELLKHGQSRLTDAHGGVSDFVPVAAQAFVLERHLRARGATLITALTAGWNGEGPIQGFMRLCVRHFLADMAQARKPKQRNTGPRIPTGATAAERSRLEQAFEDRQRLLRGEAAPLEEQPFADPDGAPNGEGGEAAWEDGIAANTEAGPVGQTGSAVGGAGAWFAEPPMDQIRQWVDEADLTPLDRAILKQCLGLEEAQAGGVLAARFGVTASFVSQRKGKVMERLEQALG